MVLRYFGIRVTNLERSLNFYTKLLGLKVKRQGTMRHGGRWILLEDGRSHQRLELNWYPKHSPYATLPYEPGDGLDHIGFKMQEAKSTFNKLVARGATPALAPLSHARRNDKTLAHPFAPVNSLVALSYSDLRPSFKSRDF